MELSAIYYYPVKGLGGISIAEGKMDARGLEMDRRWMVVTPTGRFITQRQKPVMALIKAGMEDGHLILRHKTAALSPMRLPQADKEGERMTVRVWDDTCEAVKVSDELDGWLSEALDMACHLVFMPDDSIRPLNTQYVSATPPVSFVDSFPFLVIGQASLDALNERLDKPVPMNRFRPNFVFTGGTPHEEDSWKRFRIGESVFYAAKPCARCAVPTVDQDTGERGIEPSATLSTYRKRDREIYFGMNVLRESGTSVKVGDRVGPL